MALAWYSTSWKNRKIIVINNTTAGSITNAIAKIVLTTTNFNYSKAQADLDDIRFTSSDGTTLLDYDIIETNTSGDSEFAVRIPTLASGNNTIYMYYNNSGASAGSNASGCWTDYSDVLHLRTYDSGAGTSPAAKGTGLTNVAVVGTRDGGLEFDSAGSDGADWYDEGFSSNPDVFLEVGFISDKKASATQVLVQAVLENNGGLFDGFGGFGFQLNESFGLVQNSVPRAGGFCCNAFGGNNGSWGTGTLYHYQFAHDYSAGETKAVLSGGTKVTTTGATGAYFTNGASIRIGTRKNNTGNQFDGVMKYLRKRYDYPSDDWMTMNYKLWYDTSSVVTFGANQQLGIKGIIGMGVVPSGRR